ncbi:MAG: hotdog fold domain-containing protein [Pseudomonadota bacterium]
MNYIPSKSPMLALWNKLGGSAPGRWLFGRIVSFSAPYFGSIKPRFVEVRPGRVEVAVANRRAVRNHLKTVHAIAMCNAAELAGGVCLDVSLHADFRWIPVGMTVRYQKMAKTDLTAVCEVASYDWASPQDVVMPVGVFDTNGEEVFHADITMRVSSRG